MDSRMIDLEDEMMIVDVLVVESSTSHPPPI